MHLVSLIPVDKFYGPYYAQKNIVFKNIYIRPPVLDGSILTQFTVDICHRGT